MVKALHTWLVGKAHGLRTPSEEIAFTARPKIKSKSQILRYGRSIFCLPLRPKISDFFDLCLDWVSVVRGRTYQQASELRVSQAHYPLDVVQLIFIVSIPGVSFWALPQHSGEKENHYCIVGNSRLGYY